MPGYPSQLTIPYRNCTSMTIYIKTPIFQSWRILLAAKNICYSINIIDDASTFYQHIGTKHVMNKIWLMIHSEELLCEWPSLCDECISMCSDFS